MLYIYICICISLFTPFRMCVYVYIQQHVWLLAQACALSVISEPLPTFPSPLPVRVLVPRAPAMGELEVFMRMKQEPLRNCIWSHLGCPNRVDKTWPFLSCRVCLTPPPAARRLEQRLPEPPPPPPPPAPPIPGPPPTTKAYNSAVTRAPWRRHELRTPQMRDGAPPIPGPPPTTKAYNSAVTRAPCRRHEFQTPQMRDAAYSTTVPWLRWPPTLNINEFELWEDGSGGKDTWGVGVADVRLRRDLMYGGYEMHLGDIRDGREDGNMAEILGLYCALSYARDKARTTTGGGIIVCDKTSLLTNILRNDATDPVTAVGHNLVRHAMIRTLEVHSYVRFVHKRWYGLNDNWHADALATQAKRDAAKLDSRIELPCPLRTGTISYAAPQWSVDGLLWAVTIVRSA